MPIETLVDRVWHDAPPVEARNVHYSHLSRVRRLLRNVDGVTLDRRGPRVVGAVQARVHPARPVPHPPPRAGAEPPVRLPSTVDVQRVAYVFEYELDDALPDTA